MKAQDMYRVQCLDCERLDECMASQASVLLVAESHMEYFGKHDVIITRVTLCISEEK